MFLKYFFLLFSEVQFFAICSKGVGFSYKKLNNILGSKTTWSKREDSVGEAVSKSENFSHCFDDGPGKREKM